jgi:hypothetical protein
MTFAHPFRNMKKVYEGVKRLLVRVCDARVKISGESDPGS